MAGGTDLDLEQQALRELGVLGNAGPYGNLLYAFEYALLPPEGKQVLELIANAGPFPFPQKDGSLYGNRSRDLPGTALYREFTVPTPGVSNRGRRRLVVRANGVVFFTACHYDRVPGQLGSVSHAQAIATIDAAWRNGFYLVTGIGPEQRARIAEGMKKIHNARLPAIIPQP